LAAANGSAKNQRMSLVRFRAAAALAAAAVLLTLGGCSHNKRKGDTNYVARDIETLYAAARDQLDRHHYKQAAELFDEVERQHPYSIWARRAELMSAFSYYQARSYPDAITTAQRFLSIHPGSRDAAYAYYIIAVSHYEQITDVYRDQKETQQALDALGELIRRYPNTKYAADARLKSDLVRDHLAGKEMEIGRFYQKTAQPLAATYRFRTVVDQYQTTSHTPEALERLVETYLQLGLREEAKKAAAVLGANYPGSKWYERAYALARKYPPA
jgi:outer membrane protein assembly factor BamD